MPERQLSVDSTESHCEDGILYDNNAIICSHKCIPPQHVKLEVANQHNLAFFLLNDFIILTINLRPGSRTADMCIRLWRVQLPEYYVTITGYNQITNIDIPSFPPSGKERMTGETKGLI